MTGPATDTALPRLRLYVARETPNSARAEQNLSAALAELGDMAAPLGCEIVDVFSNAKRAVADGVIITPTLIGLKPNGRVVMIGDLTDRTALCQLLRSLLGARHG